MANKPLKTVGKKKQPAAVETSSSLQDKVDAFLKAGGEIEQVKSGVSGQPSMAPPKSKPSSKPAEDASNGASASDATESKDSG